MEDATPIQTDELAESFARRMRINQADLVNRIRQSLQETLFTNRAEMRPREVANIAAEEAEMLISALPHPELGGEHGAKLSQMGLSIQTVLALVLATRRFVLAIFEKDVISQVLDAVDIYQNAVMRGYIQEREKLILSEQERIRGAMQIAIGRFTVEIKDIQAMAQRANEANEFKTRFIARVSHELRTPLGALLGMSEMLQQSVYGSLSPAQLDITQRIINNTHALERTFTELLDQSQIELGQLRLKEAEFSPKELVQEVYSNNLALALQKGLAMHVEVDSALPDVIIGDKTRIEQILSNLVVNAIKYTQTGSILIRARKEGVAHWILQVKDSGVGISKGDQAFIFEPFRQADETIGRGYSGVGLGLAIVHQLVMLMNGSVSVESELDHGSTFTVALPLRTA